MAVATILVNRPRHYAVFTYVGTTAAQNIHLGFKPSYMIIGNATDGDDVNFWHKSSQTTFINIAAAAANISAAVASIDNGTEIGFSLPSDSDINENGKTYHGIAFYE
mgnify:CR=1 FL=1|jgi:hypothetical protein